MTTFNKTYDTATPAGSDDPAEADDRMREIKAGVQERDDVDHYWPLTGTEVSDADAAEHRKITLRTLSAVVVAALTATKAYLYRLVTDGELYFKDASNNTIKLTIGGILNSLNLTGAQTVAGVKTFSSIPKIPTTAPTVNAEVAGKKYVDDQIAAKTGGGTATTVDSESNTLLKAHAYLTQTAGFVGGNVNSQTADLRGYIGATTDPAGAGTRVQRARVLTGSEYANIYFFVPNGAYFEVTNDGAPAITWTPLVVGGASPIDQD